MCSGECSQFNFCDTVVCDVCETFQSMTRMLLLDFEKMTIKKRGSVYTKGFFFW